MSWYSYGYYRPYVSVAQRRAKAAREVQKLKKNGRTVTPVAIEGNKIATTFWGKAWCDNLESYSDLANRLPRGRSYVKNGSVCDLQVEPGKVSALVCGSELYRIAIKIKPLATETWRAIKAQCAGQIGSMVELLQGKLSKSVMEVVTRRDGGLFPKPREIDMNCSCPDAAYLCKHLAATLYGVGARLDHQPELLFTLRQVDHLELITEAGAATAQAGKRATPRTKTIAAGDLADVFGIDVEGAAEAPPTRERSAAAPSAPPAAPSSAPPTTAPTARKATTAKRSTASRRNSAPGAEARPRVRGAAPAKSVHAGSAKRRLAPLRRRLGRSGSDSRRCGVGRRPGTILTWHSDSPSAARRGSTCRYSDARSRGMCRSSASG